MNYISAIIYILQANPRTADWIARHAWKPFLDYVITTVVADHKDFSRTDLARFLCNERAVKRSARKYGESSLSKSFPLTRGTYKPRVAGF